MKTILLLLLVVSPLLLTSCVVVPLSRTYYEPNPADGILTRSSSCGWHATALDTLKRDVGGIEISVMPIYDKGHPFRLYVLLGKTSMAAVINPDMFEIRSRGHSTQPATTVVKDAGPYFFQSIHYTLPKSFDEDEISLMFLPGFLKLDGKDMDIAPFRFRRVTKSDVYYGSINC